MTITLSPEVEADIRELLRLWGWDANDPLLAEATARAAMVNGLRSVLEATRDAKAAIAPMQAGVIGERGLIPQSVPDARVFEEATKEVERHFDDPYNAFMPAFEASMPPFVIPDGKEWQNSQGERFVWRGGRHGEWIPLPEREEGGAK